MLNASTMIHHLQAGKRLLAPGPQMPVYLLVFVTSRCDAKCGHCFYWRDLNMVKHELSVDEYEALARSVGPTFQITLTGGSPELRKELPEIAGVFHRHCRPANMTLCMVGRHTDRVVAQVESILEKREGLPLTVGLSLDGLGEEHDQLRGMPGLFDHLMKTFDKLGQLKSRYPQLSLAAAIVVSSANHENAGKTARWAWDNLPIDLMKPILIRGEPKDADLLGPMCQASYLQLVDQERVRLREHRNSFLASLVRAKEAVSRDLISQISSTGHSSVTCAGGRETAVIYPNGAVAGCELRSDVLGHLRDVDMQFPAIWKNAEADRFRATSGRVTECAGCYHHCFISPAIFRSPNQWLKLAANLWA
jgi:MoaA/NifB/PqqE/SkfB family radical SAM enzyme